VVQATGLGTLVGLFLFAVLLAVGITAQFAMMRRERPATAT
jgi:C4-dicarboxylate transporter